MQHPITGANAALPEQLGYVLCQPMVNALIRAVNTKVTGTLHAVSIVKQPDSAQRVAD